MDTKHAIDSVFSSTMNELHFDVMSSSGQTYELIPNGKLFLEFFKDHIHDFFTIDLSEYTTIEIMYKRLNYAMSACTSIDDDGPTMTQNNFTDVFDKI